MKTEHRLIIVPLVGDRLNQNDYAELLLANPSVGQYSIETGTVKDLKEIAFAHFRSVKSRWYKHKGLLRTSKFEFWLPTSLLERKLD